MPKTSKNTAHEYDMTKRLVLFVVLVGIVTFGLVLVVSKIGERGGVIEKRSEEQQESSLGILGEGGISKTTCEASRGYWVECGNPCHGGDEEFCAQVCEPQCLCGGSNTWQCPTDFHCADFEKLASDEKEIGVCRQGRSEPVKEEETEVKTGPIREIPNGMLCDEDNFICIYEDVEGSLLANPFEVTGSGIAFESTINWQLLDDEKNILNEGSVIADAPDMGKPGNFSIREFILSPPVSDEGVLRVFEYSAKDGEPIHIVQIPVKLPTATMTSRVFLPAESSECSEVVSEDISIVKTILPIEASLQALLRESGGERSAIPRNTRLESIVVSNGTARVVFSVEIEDYGGGSCNVQAIRAQIESTLKHFSSVQNVEISVTGKTPEETLQP